MARRTDPAITKRAINLIARVKKAGKLAPKDSDKSLTGWEDEFLDSLEERLEKYGAAFVDPDLGAMNAPLSMRQGIKLMQIKRKTAQKTGVKSKPLPQEKTKSAFANRKPLKTKTQLKAKKPMARKSSIRNKSGLGRNLPKE